MAQTDYAAKKFWEDAVLDISVPDYIQTDKIGLMNNTIKAIFSLVHPASGNSYIRKTTLQVVRKGKYSVSGTTGTFTASTKLLTHSNITNGNSVVGFAVTDQETKMHLRIGATIYDCYVDKWISTTVVKLRGFLPSIDSVVDSVTIANTVPDGNIVSIAGLDINLFSTQKLTLESSLTKYVDAVSLERYLSFITSGVGNESRIIYVYESDQILFKGGDSVASIGTLTLHYPSNAKQIESDEDFVDLPAAALPMAVLHLRTKILMRTGKNVDESLVMERLMSLMTYLYRAAGLEVQQEESAEKVKAIL